MVILDACCSAQTSLGSKTAAANSDVLTQNAATFASAFGGNVAYVGWAWEMRSVNGVQIWTSEFVNNLKGGNSVQAALTQFRQDNATAPNAKLLKIHGNTGVIIDLKASATSNP